MKRLSNSDMLDFYVKKYRLNSVFEKDMVKHMEIFSYEKCELICTKNDTLEFLYFLVEGKVKIYTLHDNGKSILLRFNKPLSILGDLEFLTGYKVQCNVESLNDTLLIGITMKDLKRHAIDDNSFLKFIIRSLSHKLYTISNSTSINLLYPLESRLASYLLSINSDGVLSSTTHEIKTMKLTEMAPLLGTSYRHLNRIVNELVSKDVIRKRKGAIIINNLDKLKELSCGNLYE